METSSVSGQKTTVITGATSGLGEAAAVALAAAGHRVLAVGRDRARGSAMVERAAAAGGRVEFLQADLFSLEDVGRLANDIRARAPRVDVLINNAGGTFAARQSTPDGLERTFALNVAAPYALVEALRGPLEAAGGRVVNVVTGVPSGARARVEELAGPGAGAGMGAYVRSKLALMALTRSWQRRYGDRGITFAALHPGIIPGTRFGQETPAWLRAVGEFIARLLRLTTPLEEATARYVRLADGPLEPGGFYHEGELRKPPSQADDPSFASALEAALQSSLRTRKVLPL